MGWEDVLATCGGFEWDTGNANKIWKRHRVAPGECEEAFFNKPLVVGLDEKHSLKEERLYGLGQTDAGRRLFIVFTIRGHLIRVISARDMNRKEREIYES